MFSADQRRQIEALYETSKSSRWGVPRDEFFKAVERGVGSATGAGPDEISRLLAALRAEDLALALGCARGNQSAWDTFCSNYRAVLYDAARAFTRQDEEARDLADSLLAELYGLDSKGSERRSRFEYFHGRSSLKTWLRAVLYQRFVDEYRRRSRFDPLPEETAEPAASERSASEPDDRRYAQCLTDAVEAALGELEAPEKLLLGYYYVQELTLKQIGRLTGEHEATISRHLDRLRARLRKRIEGYLRRVKKLGAFEIDRCLDFASRGVGVKLERALREE